MKKPKNGREDPNDHAGKDAETDERLDRAMKAMARIWRGKGPTPDELAAAPLLDFWAVTAVDGHLALTGVVTDHPTLRRGARIVTSMLLWVSDDRRAARTLSRFYRLGKPLETAVATRH